MAGLAYIRADGGVQVREWGALASADLTSRRGPGRPRMAEVPRLVRRNLFMLLLHVEGMKVLDIAAVMGVSRWTVQAGIADARQLGPALLAARRRGAEDDDQADDWERAAGIAGGRRHRGRSGGVAGVPIVDRGGRRRIG